jgi:hypothetical protein
VEPERRYDLRVSLITACNTTCALAGLYHNEVFETAFLSGPLTSISSYVIASLPLDGTLITTGSHDRLSKYGCLRIIIILSVAS